MPHTILYGGTFDPIHHGHLITSRAACEQLRADRILLLPARVSPHKTGEPPATTDDQRREMIRLAIQAGGGDVFAMDDRELKREGPSYTFDTVEQLQRENPKERYTLLLGSDQLARLHTWHRIEELLERVQVAILSRPMTEALDRAFNAVRERLGTDVADILRRRILMTPLIDIAASTIRFRVRQGLPISYLVPEPVALYITAARLYMDSSPV